MREINYAGGQFTTTNDVSDALLQLAVGLAKASTTDRIEVPIVLEGAVHDVAWLVVGLGSSMLSMPSDWVGVEPDFSGQATMMQMHAAYPRTATATSDQPSANNDAAAQQWDDLWGL